MFSAILAMIWDYDLESRLGMATWMGDFGHELLTTWKGNEGRTRQHDSGDIVAAK